MSIKVENLSYIYMKGTPFEVTAISNINFEIEQGEFVGIIGHTGSGKSTLIQHLNGLLIPSEGKITIDEFEISSQRKDLKEIRRRVGLVFQYPEHQLFEETVEKDVAFGPKNFGWEKDRIEQSVKTAIEDVGLDFEEVRSLSPFDLSGGQKRRVAIAGVLAMDPEIIIFDEPTAGLDPQGREKLFEQIKKIRQNRNKTIILISHSMDDAARLADRIFVMHKGQIIKMGKPADIFEEENNLEEIGLDEPQMTSLAKKLNSTGKFNVSCSCFTTEEMKKEILNSLGGCGNV